MKLAETKYDNSETGCCARLDVTFWDEQRLDWEDKLFLQDHIRSFLHIPLNFGAVIGSDQAAVEAAGAFPERPFWLTDEVSPWGAEVYLAVDRPVPDAKMTTLSGTFLTKVFEGPYRDIGKWESAMDAFVRAKGHSTEKTYFFYATCPTCAQHYGKNQVVLFARVSHGATAAS
jgi:hypothetical protein